MKKINESVAGDSLETNIIRRWDACKDKIDDYRQRIHEYKEYISDNAQRLDSYSLEQEVHYLKELEYKLSEVELVKDVLLALIEEYELWNRADKDFVEKIHTKYEAKRRK